MDKTNKEDYATFILLSVYFLLLLAYSIREDISDFFTSYNEHPKFPKTEKSMLFYPKAPTKNADCTPAFFKRKGENSPF